MAHQKNSSESKTTEPEKFRFQIELSIPVKQRLDELVTDTDSASRAEVIRRALGFYALLVKEAKAGQAIEIVNKGNRSKRREIVVLEAEA